MVTIRCAVTSLSSPRRHAGWFAATADDDVPWRDHMALGQNQT